MRDLKNSVPKGDWFCQRCDYLIHNNLEPSAVQCIYCKDLTGIIVPLCHEYSRDDDSCSWVHITCVNQIKEIHFMERKTKIRVYDTPKVLSPATGIDTSPDPKDAFVSPKIIATKPSHTIEEMVDWTVGLSGRIKGSLGREFWSSICVLCLIPGGATIACDYARSACQRRYHVRCGIKIGLIRPVEEMTRDPEEQNNFLAFCD